MPRRKNTFRDVFAPFLEVGIPVAAVLAVLVFASELRVGPAIAAGAILGIVLGMAAFVRQSDLLALTSYVRRVLTEDETVAEPIMRTDVGTLLLSLISRLAQRFREKCEERAALAEIRGAVIDSLPDPLLMLDRHRRITDINRAATVQFGDDLAGRDLAMALRHPGLLSAADAVLAGQETGREVEIHLPGVGARDFNARVLSVPHRSADGTAVVVVLHDLTATIKAERMRVDFIANVSHELRTPLSTLIGFIETLRGPARDDAEARARFLAIMDEQAARMSRLIGDLLSLSRIELDEHTPPTERVAVAPLVGSVAKALEPKAAERGVTIAIEPAESLPDIVGDRDQLYQVFENLVYNAVKYGRKDGEVTVSFVAPGDAGGRAGRLGVRVCDQGEGIAREHIPRLTERFYRVDNARSRALGGTGLGLAIAKHIVNRHRGQLVISSEVGRGSSFTVYLPLADA